MRLSEQQRDDLEGKKKGDENKIKQLETDATNLRKELKNLKDRVSWFKI